MEYKFLQNLRIELHFQNLTRKELSEKTKIPLSTINGWFAKNLTPDVISAYKIACALNTTVEYLLTGIKTQKDELEDLRSLKESLQNLVDNYDHLKVEKYNQKISINEYDAFDILCRKFNKHFIYKINQYQHIPYKFIIENEEYNIRMMIQKNEILIDVKPIDFQMQNDDFIGTYSFDAVTGRMCTIGFNPKYDPFNDF